jgi:hypothetical protein
MGIKRRCREVLQGGEKAGQGKEEQPKTLEGGYPDIVPLPGGPVGPASNTPEQNLLAVVPDTETGASRTGVTNRFLMLTAAAKVVIQPSENRDQHPPRNQDPANRTLKIYLNLAGDTRKSNRKGTETGCNLNLTS